MAGRSFLFGYSVLSARRTDIERLMNLCGERAIPFSDIVIDEEGESARLSVPLVYEKKLLRCAMEQGIELTVVSRRGIPALAYRHRKRAGLLVGAVLAAVLFFYSSGLVWDVRIEGAERVSEKELLAVFEECGLSVGAKKKDIDADVLENQILVLSDEISWVSVNISGNVANVEVRETDHPLPDENGDILYSNVVAAEDGIIVGYEDISGSISADIGEAVSKGQLLISGITGAEGQPMRLMKADGKVFAEVEKQVEIRIPQAYIKKVTKERVKTEKSLIFFKNEIKFFSNSRNSELTCDKIEVIENFYTVNEKKLPIALKTVNYIEYEEVEVSRSSLEMRELALLELNRYINEILSNCEILSKSLSFSELDGELLLSCNIKCIKNIAELREILVS